jgi:hypothetical protein
MLEPNSECISMYLIKRIKNNSLYLCCYKKFIKVHSSVGRVSLLHGGCPRFESGWA